MKPKNNIAILYFSRSVKAEAESKSWNRNSCVSHNKRVARSLNRKTRKTLDNVGLDVFHSCETNQQGENFGEKLSNAYQDVFDLGYDAVISVGNDCPQLDEVNWEKVCDELLYNSVVLGPTTKNGAYLIGMTKEAFEPIRFAKLPWQTNHLQGELQAYFHQFKVFFLAEKRDLNNDQDLLEFSQLKGISAKLRSFILLLVMPFYNVIYKYIFCVNNLPPVQILSLRAPPSM